MQCIIVTFLMLSFSPFINIATLNTVKAENVADVQSFLPPTVVVAILARNKGHTLPWYLGHLELLDYPKDRISLW